jgi:hypothetical protein
MARPRGERAPACASHLLHGAACGGHDEIHLGVHRLRRGSAEEDAPGRRVVVAVLPLLLGDGAQKPLQLLCSQVLQQYSTGERGYGARQRTWPAEAVEPRQCRGDFSRFSPFVMLSCGSRFFCDGGFLSYPVAAGGESEA